MIRHVVLVRFKPQADTPKILAALKSLQDKIDGIIAISAGSDNSPAGLQLGHIHDFTADFHHAAAPRYGSPEGGP